jgi:YVTN family beta-propeller protein
MRMLRRASCFAFLLVLLSPSGAAPLSKPIVPSITEIPLSPFDTNGPDHIAVDPARGRAYAVSPYPNRLWVLDTSTNQQVDSFRTDGNNPSDIVVEPQSGLVYLTNFGSTYISVLDGATDTWLAPIEIGVQSKSITLAPGRNRAYVTTYHDTVLVLDLANRTVVATIQGRFFMLTENVAVDALRPRAYVQSDGGFEAISVVDTRVNLAIRSFPTHGGSNGSALAVDPAIHKLYVSNENGTLSVFDTTGDVETPLGLIPVSSGAVDVVVNPALHRAYVANYADDTVSAIDTRRDIVIGTVPVGDRPSSIAVDAATERVYVANKYSAYVSVLGE